MNAEKIRLILLLAAFVQNFGELGRDKDNNPLLVFDFCSVKPKGNCGNGLTEVSSRIAVGREITLWTTEAILPATVLYLSHLVRLAVISLVRPWFF